MAKLRRSCEEVDDIDILTEEDSPVFCRRTYVFDSDGNFIKPSKTIDPPIVEIFDYASNRLRWIEEWDVPEGGIAIEVLMADPGGAFRIVEGPESITDIQLKAVNDILGDYDLSWSKDRDDDMQSVVYRTCEKFIPEIVGDKLVFKDEAKPNNSH